MLIDGARSKSPRRARAMDCGVNLVCADRVGESILPGLSVRENFFLNPLRRRPPARPNGSRPPPRCRASRALGETVGLRPERPQPRHRAAVGRQSAEGRGRPLAATCTRAIYVFEDPTAGVDVGAKAEIYRLFDVALREGAAIVIISTDFEEIAKVCHRALVFDRGRVVETLHGDDLSISNLLAAASASIERAGRRRGVRADAVDQIQRARADQAGTGGDDDGPGDPSPGAGLRPADPDAAVDRAVLDPAAGHVSDLAQPALDPRRQVDRRAAGAGGDAADDGRAHRPHRRLRHRHVAHSGDQPAGLVRRSLAAGDRDRPGVRRRRRPHQRLAGRSRAGRRLRRDAWHRHHPLRAGALAHRRHAGRRHDGARLSRHQLDHDPTSVRLAAGAVDSDSRLLRSGARGGAVGGHRAAADRPLHLRHRRQREGRRAERHSGARAT